VLAKVSGVHTVLQIRASGLGSHLIRYVPRDPPGQNMSVWGVRGHPKSGIPPELERQIHPRTPTAGGPIRERGQGKGSGHTGRPGTFVDTVTSV
jgi:hypothetical protein